MADLAGKRAKEWAGATILITGGTGSFGSTMVRYLQQKNVSEIRVFSRDEVKQDVMRRELGDPRITFHIGDTRSYDSVTDAVKGADYVFHAAAIKQVPTGEFFPMETVKTNILGSQNVLRASMAAGVKSLVCLSTDKAVYPINAMGMSKAIMEKLAVAAARQDTSSGTRINITRYGNVMNSRGSVIPLFVDQIRKGLPLTLTNPNMTRFLMSLEDSVALVEEALLSGNSGDLYVRKSPSCTMENLSAAILELTGKTHHEIKIIGTRHGEKLHETLLSSEEMLRAEDDGLNFRVPLDGRDLNYQAYFDEGLADSLLEPNSFSSDSADLLVVEDVRNLLMTIPEIAAAIAGLRH